MFSYGCCLFRVFIVQKDQVGIHYNAGRVAGACGEVECDAAAVEGGVATKISLHTVSRPLFVLNLFILLSFFFHKLRFDLFLSAHLRLCVVNISFSVIINLIFVFILSSWQRPCACVYLCVCVFPPFFEDEPI